MIARLRELLARAPKTLTRNDLDDGSGYVDEDTIDLILETHAALPALLAVAEALVQARETLLHWEASTVIPADFDNTLATANTALAALQKGRP
jgi:hypothetical protein